jgi:hypothetical protein
VKGLNHLVAHTRKLHESNVIPKVKSTARMLKHNIIDVAINSNTTRGFKAVHKRYTPKVTLCLAQAFILTETSSWG